MKLRLLPKGFWTKSYWTPRRGWQWTLGVFALLLMLACSAVAFVMSDAGRDALAPRLVAALAPEGGAIHYRHLGGNWPQDIIVDGLQISDAQGEWLSIDRLVLDWKPWHILRRNVDVTLLRFEKPVLARMPQGSASQESGSISLQLPVNVHLDALELSEGEIKTPLAARFEAHGQVALEKGKGAARIEAQRLGDLQEFVKLDAAFDSLNRVLKLDADIKSEKGGLLATLAGMPDLPAVTLKAKGEGPAQDWMLALNGEAAGFGDIALNGTLNWAQDIALDLQGVAHAQKDLGPQIRELASGGVTLDAHWTRKSGADDLRTALSSAMFDLNLNVGLGAENLLKARVLTGSISAQTKGALHPAEGFKLGGLTASSTLSGSIVAPDMAVTLEANGLETSAARIGNLKGLVNLETRQGAADTRYHLTGSGDMHDIVQKGARFLEAANWTLDATQEGPLTQLSSVKLNAQGLDATAQGQLDARSGKGEGKAVLEAADLAVLAPLVGTDISGAGHLDLTATRAGLDAPWLAVANANTTELSVAGTSFTPVAGPQLTLTSRASLAPSGAMALDELKIDGDKLSLTAKGALTPKLDMQAALDGTLAVLQPLAGLDAQGPLALALNAKGTLDAPLLDATLQSKQAMIEGRDLGALKAQIVPQGADRLFTFDAKGPLGVAQLRAPLRQDAKTFVIGPIDGNAYGAALSGTLQSGANGLTGALKAVIANLASLAPLALGPDVKAEGNAIADVNFLGKDGINAKIAGRGLSLSSPDVSASELNADIHFGTDIRVAASLKGGELPGVSAPIFYDTLVLNAAGPRKAIKVDFKSDGLTGAGGNLSLSGLLDIASPTQSFDLSSLSARLWGTPIALVKPTKLTFGAAQMALASTALRVDANGLITSSFAQKPGAQALDVTLADFPIPFMGHILNVDWPQGALEGKLNLDTARARGNLDIALKNAQFSRATMSRMTPLNGTAKGDWNGKIFSLKSVFRRETGVPIIIEGQLPLENAGGGALRLNPQGKVAGNVQWDGRVGTLWTFLPLDLYRVDGDGKLRITAAGTWGKPKIEGRFDLAGGTFEGLSTGTRLSDLVLALDANTSSAHFTLSGSDGGAGRLKGEGKMSFDTTRNFPLAGSLDLTSLRIVGLDEVTAIASGHTALSGSLGAMALKGDLTFDRVDALIPDKLPPSVPQLPVTYADAAAQPKATADAADDAKGMALDIKVKVPGRASLNGRGLISEWKGDLAISGTTSAPVITGAANLARGTLAFAGRSFPLTKGTVSFDGGTDIDPRLDIAAVRTVNSTAITLAVTGRASAPVITISSQPPVPQDEAMALLLLGKPAGSLTPLELLDVARAMATLSGTSIGGGGLDIVDRARRTLGLDVLTIDTTTGAGGDASGFASTTSLNAGRYVTDKVYLGVKQGATAGSSAVQMEVELTPNITATTEVGQQTGGSAGINWKWDY